MSPTSGPTWTKSARRSISLTVPRRDDATTKDPEGFPHLKTVAGSWVGWQTQWHPGNWCEIGQRICCFNYFQFSQKEKRDSDQNVVHSLRDKKNLHKILEREVDLAVRKERVAKQKLYEAEAEVEAGNWEKRNSVFAFQEIRSLNLSAFSYTKQVDGQIRLREIKSACMENWNWETGSSKKIIAEKLKNWEEFVAKKQIEQHKQELMNCLCINRGILRLWGNCWLRLGIAE